MVGILSDGLFRGLVVVNMSCRKGTCGGWNSVHCPWVIDHAQKLEVVLLTGWSTLQKNNEWCTIMVSRMV